MERRRYPRAEGQLRTENKVAENRPGPSIDISLQSGVDIYLEDVGRIPRLEDEETQALGTIIQTLSAAT